ncbi:hypothetical protein CEXT_287921 [Caerostris extrusa]|uniref:Uncharacterized protein n=1 Tax=Caerostris extrusa TaxID=172846 RepID=A0AAV4UYD0_CAEEX|nr:hypothetical protein CEXT_287921 [Caerostris extrusa]
MLAFSFSSSPSIRATSTSSDSIIDVFNNRPLLSTWVASSSIPEVAFFYAQSTQKDEIVDEFFFCGWFLVSMERKHQLSTTRECKADTSVEWASY